MFAQTFVLKIEIGKLIKQKIEEKGLKKTYIAKKINKHIGTLYRRFDKEDVNTNDLMELSEIIGYNFFYDLLFDERLEKLYDPIEVKHLKAALTNVNPSALQEELSACKEEVEKLRNENHELHRSLWNFQKKNEMNEPQKTQKDEHHHRAA